MRVFSSFEELAAAVGETIGPGPWQRIEQSRVDLFADATDDHQWIHLDPDRAAAGPFGGTIAHGYLTLSLSAGAGWPARRVEGVAMGVNYGLNKVRFPRRSGSAPPYAPPPPSPRCRRSSGGVQMVVTVTVESDSGGKPVCVAETVSRLYPATGR